MVSSPGKTERLGVERSSMGSLWKLAGGAIGPGGTMVVASWVALANLGRPQIATRDKR